MEKELHRGENLGQRVYQRLRCRKRREDAPVQSVCRSFTAAVKGQREEKVKRVVQKLGHGAKIGSKASPEI